MPDFINGVTLKRGDGTTPTEVFTPIEGLKGLSGFGKVNPLVDVTDFDSAGREYIAGLADGQEITMEFNHDQTASTELSGLLGDVDAGTNRNLQIVMDDGTVTWTYEFAVVPLSWVVNPSYEDANSVTVTAKISGAITKTVS